MGVVLFILSEFFREKGALAQQEFLAQYDGGFLLSRFHRTPPAGLFLPRSEGLKVIIGSDEAACDLEIQDPTLDPRHLEITYHTGFRGWMVKDLGTAFGTHLDGDRLRKETATLLQDGSVLKPGGGLSELQFYKAATLYTRMSSAGITHITRAMRKANVEQRGMSATDVAKGIEFE